MRMALSDSLDSELPYTLGSRLTCQQGRDRGTKVVVQKRILVRHDECALALSSILKNCKSLDMMGGYLSVDIRRDGWAL